MNNNKNNNNNDQHILNKNKMRRKNLAMAWIDHNNAYDVVVQSWILHCLKMYKISDEIMKIIEKTLKTWRMELTTRGKRLADVKIQRDIFTITICNSDDATQSYYQEIYTWIQTQ